FWREFVKQLWPLNLIRYLRTQAMSNAMPGVRSPYERSNIDRSKTKIALRVGIYYLLGLAAALAGLVALHAPLLLSVVPAAASAAVMAFFFFIADDWYSQYRVHPTYSMRVINLMRVTFVTIVAVAVAWLAYAYGRFAFYYVVLLWIVPMLTSFSLF